MKCLTGKVSYPTYYAADKENKRKIKLHGIKMDVYKCRFCNQYHLTGHNRTLKSTPYNRRAKNVKELSRRSNKRIRKILEEK